MADREMENFLAGVVGVVEADSYGGHMLWNENRRRDNPRTWNANTAGFHETVGHFCKNPVCLSLHTAVIDGHKILFVDAVSQVVDHRLIEGWLKRTLPKSAFRHDGYVNKVDAMNFHNVFPRTMIATPLTKDAGK